jgi:hypothetical protein
MALDRLKAKAWTDVAKNVVEIIAFVVGAAWALRNFDLLEKPTLSPRISVNSSLQWSTEEPELQGGYCKATFSVDIQNDSKVSTIRIDNGQVDLVIFKIPPNSDKPQYIGPERLEQLQKKQRQDQQASLTLPLIEAPDSLVGDYGVGSAAHRDFDFILKKGSGMAYFIFSGTPYVKQEGSFFRKARYVPLRPVVTYTGSEICG